jgi:hypothetical protein
MPVGDRATGRTRSLAAIHSAASTSADRAAGRGSPGWASDLRVGDVDIAEFDAAGDKICHHERRLFRDTPRADGIVGEMITRNSECSEIGRRPLLPSPSARLVDVRA